VAAAIVPVREARVDVLWGIGLGLSLAIACTSCEFPFTNPYDPANCEPRCPQEKVCYKGRCSPRTTGDGATERGSPPPPPSSDAAPDRAAKRDAAKKYEGCLYEVKKISQCTGTPPQEDPWIEECAKSPSSCNSGDTDAFPSKNCVGSCCTTFTYRNFRSVSACP
jgi:hypothetical protein